jgi:hypothetical protein
MLGTLFTGTLAGSVHRAHQFAPFKIIVIVEIIVPEKADRLRLMVHISNILKTKCP